MKKLHGKNHTLTNGTVINGSKTDKNNKQFTTQKLQQPVVLLKLPQFCIGFKCSGKIRLPLPLPILW